MADYRFERECRTPHSEVYTIFSDDGHVGRVDLHFTSTVVNATLCIVERLTSEDIQDLIEVIDEELVMTADVPREDLITAVYQGREVGVFTDEDFAAEEEEEGSNGHRI